MLRGRPKAIVRGSSRAPCKLKRIRPSLNRLLRLTVRQSHSVVDDRFELSTANPGSRRRATMAVEQAGHWPARAPSMLDDPLLQREWLAMAWSSEIPLYGLLGRRIMGRDLVLWRSTEGLHCWRDLCIHRGARLSLGRVRPADCSRQASNSIANALASPTSTPVRDCLICPYHAWEYAPTGECVRFPSHPELVPRPRLTQKPTWFKNDLGWFGSR